MKILSLCPLLLSLACGEEGLSEAPNHAQQAPNREDQGVESGDTQDQGLGDGGGSGALRPEESLGSYAGRTCFSDGDETPPELLDGLSQQLFEAINCLRPGALSEIPSGDWQMLDPIRMPIIQGRAVDDLLAAAEERPETLVIRWAYRDVALQHLFYLWTLKGCDFAAPPGLSNHQNGLSLDLDESTAWEMLMRKHGWENNLPNDRPHYDYRLAEDEGMATLSLLAFQALWNLNRPEEPLGLSGEFDSATEAALSAAPLEGFSQALCDAPPIALPELRGPSLAQASWRGCEIPIKLIEGLSEQLAEVMRCGRPQVMERLSLCSEPGCLGISAPPKLEWIEAQTQRALLEIAQDLNRRLDLEWAFRGPAFSLFRHQVQSQLGCPGEELPPWESHFLSGRAVALLDLDALLEGALEEAGFQAIQELEAWLYPEGEDLSSSATYAFQLLWNLNHPEEPLELDGHLSSETLASLKRAPIRGFIKQPPCTAWESLSVEGPLCVEGCSNQSCPGTYDFCLLEYGECQPVPCQDNESCEGLSRCDDPSRSSSSRFYCDGGRCRRGS